MAEDCSSALIVKKEVEDKFLDALEGATKDYFTEIEKEMEEARKRGYLGERVKIEKDGLVMWYDSNDYSGRNLYRNEDIQEALGNVCDESDWGVLCAPVDIYPLGYDIETNGELVDEAIETFGLYLNNSISYREDDIDCVFFNENYKKFDGGYFRVLFLTDEAFSEISSNDEAMDGINSTAFAHFKNIEDGSHLIMFLNCTDADPGMKPLLEAFESLDEEEYASAVFEQLGKALFCDSFRSYASDTPMLYGEAELSGDFDFIIGQALGYDVPDEIILGNKSGEETKLSTASQEATDCSKELKEIVPEIFEKMRIFPTKYGFHFSYSPESSWDSPEFLIMTINPSASDGKGKAKKIVPKTPWPQINDFFDPRNKFAIQKPVQVICYELSRLVHKPVCSGDTPMEAARNFANYCAILASFVPFRTREASDITEEMMEFARTEYWGKLFAVWQPKAIVTIGNPPFEAMQAFLANNYKVIDSTAQKVSDTSTLSYRLEKYESKEGKIITLIGLPHPTAFGEKGFPTNFPENSDQDSPLRKFLDHALDEKN